MKNSKRPAYICLSLVSALMLGACGSAVKGGTAEPEAQTEKPAEEISETEVQTEPADEQEPGSSDTSMAEAEPAAETAETEIQTAAAEDVTVTDAVTDTAASDIYSQDNSLLDEPVEKSFFALWEYEGYVDEADEYYWQDEFIDQDYDGDGLIDRLYRKADIEEQTADYRIELGNGRVINVPTAWETGFPHIQTADMNSDGEPEFLFTQTYDTATDPWYSGDMWLFEYDSAGEKYKEAQLPLNSGEKGSKNLSISYSAPDNGVVTIDVAQTGYHSELELEPEEIEYLYLSDAYSEERSVFSATADGNVIHCETELFLKSGIVLMFDIVRDGSTYRITNMK